MAQSKKRGDFPIKKQGDFPVRHVTVYQAGYIHLKKTVD